ncbi:DnaD domain-containing protein [Staphylococcus hominis]
MTRLLVMHIEYAFANRYSPKQFLLRVLSNWKNANITTLEQAQNFKISNKKKYCSIFQGENT